MSEPSTFNTVDESENSQESGKDTRVIDANISIVKVLQAIGEESRLLILQLLQKNGEMSVIQLVTAIQTQSQPNISQHLRRLKSEGFLEVRNEGKNHFYRITESLREGLGNILESVSALLDIRENR